MNQDIAVYQLPLARQLIALALEEDLAFGDSTAQLAVDSSIQACGELVAREPLVFCGAGVASALATEMRCSLKVENLISEGEEAQAGSVLQKLHGSARSLLSLERTLLNFVQRLSGIASLTRKYVEAVPELTILDTRKTTPGWRVLEKFAVGVGGGRSHRLSLSDMLLVKNNHIDANRGDLKKLLEGVMAGKGWYTPLQVEVRDLKELQQVLEFPVDAVMLDNFPLDEVKKALSYIASRAPRVKVEVSGGVDMARLQVLAASGVQCVSCGALTRSALPKDISLALRVEAEAK